jgi:hypothetical protein
MLLNSSPLRVLRRDTYDDAESVQRKTAKGERPIVWADGQLVEFVELYDESTGSILTATVDAGVNGECAAGTVGHCTFETKVEKRAVGSRGNTVDKHKFKLMDYKPTAAAKS